MDCPSDYETKDLESGGKKGLESDGDGMVVVGVKGVVGSGEEVEGDRKEGYSDNDIIANTDIPQEDSFDFLPKPLKSKSQLQEQNQAVSLRRHDYSLMEKTKSKGNKPKEK